jgi:hypothetical protein
MTYAFWSLSIWDGAVCKTGELGSNPGRGRDS